jgi:hypothetical protein
MVAINSSNLVIRWPANDGVMQAPGGSKEDTAEGFKYGGWMGPHFDETGGKEMDLQMKKTSALLLGRRTYDIFAYYKRAGKVETADKE